MLEKYARNESSDSENHMTPNEVALNWLLEETDMGFGVDRGYNRSYKEFKGFGKSARVTINKEVQKEDGKIKRVEMSINKDVNNSFGKREHTKYTLIARKLSNGDFEFTLETDDGNDVKRVRPSLEEIKHTIIPNFQNRMKELREFQIKEAKKAEKRREKHRKKTMRDMNKLAYNDQNEADDMLGNLDDFYNA